MIALNSPVTIRPAVVSTVFTVVKSEDLPSRRLVRATITFNADSTPPLKEIVVWSGDAYDAIGNWTQSQLEDAVKSIISAPGFCL